MAISLPTCNWKKLSIFLNLKILRTPTIQDLRLYGEIVDEYPQYGDYLNERNFFKA